jgi:AcrR family transcriptional regulator
VKRLTVDDWVQAGLDILDREGIAGVKIQRLCDRLGVTKGSFYWHFEDLDAFLTELANQWVASTVDPQGTLLLAMRMFADPRNRNLARGMREWAQSDERARAAIRKADQLLYERVKETIAALGFDDDDAEVRAKILYYAGVGFVAVGPLGDVVSAEEQLTATWEILTRRETRPG